MSSYIEESKSTIHSIITHLSQQEKINVRFGLVAYRDHPPQDNTWTSKAFDFTSELRIMQSYLAELTANGGGDGPEAVATALKATEDLAWRSNSAKVVIFITDAPPHGLGAPGDGFPNGDPNGLDPLSVARSMAAKGISLFPVACEPTLSSYQNARGFMVGLAEITHGQAITLSSASLLSQVILGASIEEVGLQSLSQQLQTQIQQIENEFKASKGREATPEEATSLLHSRMSSSGLKTKSWKTDGRLSDARSTYFTASTSGGSLSAAKAALQKDFGDAPLSNEGGLGMGLAGTAVSFRAGGLRMKSGDTLSTLRSSGPSPPHSATSSSVEISDVSLEQAKKIYIKAKQGH